MDDAARNHEGRLREEVAAPLSEQVAPDLERKLNLVVFTFIVIMLLCIIIIPGSWFNSASIWCRDHLPGF